LDRAKEILNRVLDHYQQDWRPGDPEPFRNLIRTILSQNTSGRNQRIAFERLDREIGVTPQSLTETEINAIMSAIRPAGMFKQRAATIKEVSQLVLKKYKGDLNSVLKKDYEEAREELMALPGVGRKTADVLLLFSGGKDVIPIDRHIHRIAQRTGIAPRNADYDDVRRKLEEAAKKERYLDVHLLLIRFGREICRARSPRCGSCFLQNICPKLIDVGEIVDNFP